MARTEKVRSPLTIIAMLIGFSSMALTTATMLVRLPPVALGVFVCLIVFYTSFIAWLFFRMQIPEPFPPRPKAALPPNLPWPTGKSQGKVAAILSESAEPLTIERIQEKAKMPMDWVKKATERMAFRGLVQATWEDRGVVRYELRYFVPA